MSTSTLTWDSQKGRLWVSAQPDRCHTSRPGSQAHTLIALLCEGPLPKERLIRKVFSMRGIEADEVQKQLEAQLRTLVSRINKTLGAKHIVLENGSYAFSPSPPLPAL